jgi:hypothetical protein
MLKYTLGALAAAVILLATGFLILSQVTDSGADQGRAPVIIVSVWDDGVWPPEITVRRNEITELVLRNESSAPKGARLEGEGVEQLPELAPASELGSSEPLPHISIEAGVASVGSVLVRMSERGEYTLNVTTPGVFLMKLPVTVIVE